MLRFRCRMHRDTLNLHQVGAVPSPEHVVTSKEPGRLATALALAALIDYLRVLEEGLESTARPALDGIEQILALEQRDSRPDVVPSKSRVLDVVHELGETVLKWSQQQNQLTDYPSPHYLQATVVLGLLRYAAQLRGESLPAASASPADAANTVQQLLKKGVGPRFEARHGTHKEESISHFVLKL